MTYPWHRCNLSELGRRAFRFTDALQCSVGYAQQEHKSSFRRVYKFSSSQPLHVKTKFHSPKALTSAFTSQRNLTYCELRPRGPLPTLLTRI